MIEQVQQCREESGRRQPREGCVEEERRVEEGMSKNSRSFLSVLPVFTVDLLLVSKTSC